MQRILKSAIPAVVGLALLLGITANAQDKDKKVDPTGTWTWTSPGRNGGEPRKSTLKLKLEGEKVTGTFSSPGRGGGAAQDTAVEDAKLAGEEITFKVTREFQGNKFVAKYNGKISGDTIKGKIETERDGQAQSRDWTATREVQQPQPASNVKIIK